MAGTAPDTRDAVLRELHRRGVKPKDAANAIQMELARRGLIDFAKRVAPWYQTPPHIVYLADWLERAERGEVHKLCISAPPGHGKSTLLQTFVAWFLGRNPRRRILEMSASESLARRNSRAVRSFVQGEEWPWPDVKLVGESLEEWQTTQGGGARAIGQTGTVTGFRAEMILCDDIQPEAGTDQYRESLEEWFRQILATRLEPGGVFVLINTRWRDDDMIGRLRDGADGDQWTFINLPAIAVDDDLLGRAPGEPLWPERWPIEALEALKLSVTPVGFATQYQGDPVPAGGAVFEPGWFENNTYALSELPKFTHGRPAEDRRDALARAIDPLLAARQSPAICIQSVDGAWKTGAHNDYSVIATLVSDLVNVYIADLWIGRVPYTDLKRIVEEQFDKWKPRAIYVEEAASGYALVDELRRAPGKIIPVVGIKPGRDDKVARAEAETSWFESGRVKFPVNAPWMVSLKQQFLRFPYAAHDDIVDAIILGIAQMRQLIARSNLQQRRQRRPNTNLSGWMGR